MSGFSDIGDYFGQEVYTTYLIENYLSLSPCIPQHKETFENPIYCIFVFSFKTHHFPC